ncbi:MAG: YXWGXW repeat-containing protein [Gemmataceae bacterium]
MRKALLLVGACLIAVLIGLNERQPIQGQESAAAKDEPPPVPEGVEVLARGPIHEAFATPTTDPVPTLKIAKQPPKALDELPPEEKPEGNVIWIGGYWSWDDDRKDFLWVSGTWRKPPPNKQWVPGYWKPDGEEFQWVAGFWTNLAKEDAPAQDVTYLPEPPKPPVVAAPGTAPAADTFYVPGYWVWNDGRYRWRDGYWARVQPNFVWVPAHYQWTPGGYVFVGGYWDVAVARRGVLYAPVYVSAGVVGASFVYTPAYAVPDTVVVDALFVRPSYCHYYYGDYYEVRYRDSGFTSCVVYSRSHYDSIVVYQTYVHRDEPTWLSIQINLSGRRESTPALRPPQTSITNVTYNNVTVQNSYTQINNSSTTINNTNTTINKNNTTFLMPAKSLATAQGVQTVKLDNATRQEAKQQAQQVQQVALKRTQAEQPPPGGKLTQPRVQSLAVPQVKPVGPVAKTATPSGFSNPNSGKTATPNGAKAMNTATPDRRTPITPNTGSAGPAIKQTGATATTTPGTGSNIPGKAADKVIPRAANTLPPIRSNGSLAPAGPGPGNPLRTVAPNQAGHPMPPPSKSGSSDKDKDKDKKKPGQPDR